MPTYAHPHLLDAILERAQSETTRILMLSDYTEAYVRLAALTLATINAPIITGPVDNDDSSGRIISVDPSVLSAVNWAVSGTATHYAFVDSVNTRILTMQELVVPFDAVAGQPVLIDQPIVYRMPVF